MLNSELDRRGGADIRGRAEAYALRAVKVYQYVRRRGDGVGMILGRQFLRAATSIGANLVEAQAGESRKDFVHKCSIAQKEARECRYWLGLLSKSEVVPAGKLDAITDETDQLVAILTRIIVNTKNRTPA